MRISFTDFEINEWIEFIEQVCDACCDEEVQFKRMMIKKFKNAQSRSEASKKKIKYIHFAQRKKDNEERSMIQEEVLRKYTESKE